MLASDLSCLVGGRFTHAVVPMHQLAEWASLLGASNYHRNSSPLFVTNSGLGAPAPQGAGSRERDSDSDSKTQAWT